MAKTNPTSIRFDTEKLEFVKNKEGLTTPQKVVDFFLDGYWWRNKLNTGQPSISPPAHPIIPDIPMVSPYEAYKLDLTAAGSIEAIKKIVKASEKDSGLAEWQKKQIETIGIHLSQKLDF